MKSVTAALILLLSCLGLHAQEEGLTLQSWVDRLDKFGQSIPQEEVFVHLDNSSYFVGDTIFYKAYCRLSNGKQGGLSGLLYVELLNNDGYLVEREKIRLTNGQGHGCFLLTDSLYGGFYELRAYTRWQLNWGVTEHPHSSQTKDWFYSKQMEMEYFRDYDKLYSRVFPVYDKPKEPGEYYLDMTMRPMQRYFRADHSKPEADLTFYPEGGNLVEGTTCRVAFEANDEEGKHLQGRLVVTDHTGATVAEAETQQRGRGCFLLPVGKDEQYQATFHWKAQDASEASQKEKLPKAVTEGVGLQASVDGDQIHLELQNSGTAAQEELGMTVMSHGVLQKSLVLGQGAKLAADIDGRTFPEGVTQVTVFNKLGRVYADRLVFVRHSDFQAQNITFTNLRADSYKAYESIDFDIQTTNGSKGGTISLAVRDAAHSQYTFDSGSFLTEMLLCSQLKGFVEQPEYYFEADDEEHNTALDLLLMIQGWRRYDWVQMATPGLFTLNEPYERTEMIYGEVNRYQAEEREDMFSDAAQLGLDEAGASPEFDEFKNSIYGDYAEERFIHKWKGAKAAMLAARILHGMGITAEDYAAGTGGDMANSHPSDTEVSMRMIPVNAKDKDAFKKVFYSTQVGSASDAKGNLKHEVTVHAEFVLDKKLVTSGGTTAAEGEVSTYNNGKFRIEVPAFQNYCYFFCTASDQEKWKNGKAPVWIASNETRMDANGDNGEINYPEFYVRFRQIYPRFVKPYNFYQAAQNESPRKNKNGKLVAVDNSRLLNEVVVGAKFGGKRSIDITKPALVLDAQEAFNDAVDAGFCPGYYLGATRFINDVARTYIGDMNMERRYELEPRFNKRNMTYNHMPGTLRKFEHLHKLDKVYIYTDYAPRREGDKRYRQSNQPSVSVDLRVPEDGSQFIAYRDRRRVLWGFSECVDFYHPDYSNQPTPSAKDYRRTLYWNPDLPLDEEGRAHVHFYNNSRSTNITVSAEGITTSGEALSGISYPEDR